MVRILEGRVTKQVKITFWLLQVSIEKGKGVLRRGQSAELIESNIYLSSLMACILEFMSLL